MPNSSLGKSISLEYKGWDATDNLIEAKKVGLSLQGVSRLYATTYHFYLTGQLPKRLVNPDVRILVGPPKPGSLSYAVWVFLAHGKLLAYPALLAEFVDLCVPELIKAALAKRGKRENEFYDASEKIYDMAKDNIEIANRVLDFATEVHRDHVRDKEKLHSTIEFLAQKNGPAMIEMVSPVGTSVKQLNNASGSPSELLIDEPMADVIRAQGDLEVEDEREMKVSIGAIDKINKTCRVLSNEFPHPIKGRITDPALMTPGNVYTGALDKAETLIIKGKPAFKDGKIHTLYISDARLLD